MFVVSMFLRCIRRLLVVSSSLTCSCGLRDPRRMRSLALLALAGSAAALSFEDPAYSYDHWLAEGWGKKFAGSRAIFEQNLARIRRHNSNPAHTWKMGVNHFTGA